jgi:membrane fusion protein, copper/silver efflux system
MKTIITIITVLFLFISGTSFAQQHDSATHQKSMAGEQIKPLNTPTQFKAQLDSLFNVYYQLQSAFSHDSLKDVKAAAGKIENALNSIDMKLLSGDTHMKWMDVSMGISDKAKEINQSTDIEKARLAFSELSKEVYLTAKTFGTSGNSAMYYFHCPMAFNKKGADWLENDKTAKNPYFGKSMLGCGELKETLSTGKKAK